jgi:hypothetical protein
MSIDGNEFTVSSEYSESVNNLFLDTGSLDKIKNEVPGDVVTRVISHPDISVLAEIGDLVCGVELPNIVGPYKVYNKNMTYLCTVNLHRGAFGNTFPEINYFSKMTKWDILYVAYVDIDSNIRNIQIIKKD